MSKASKPRDLKRQLYESEADRKGYCPGCGYFPAVNEGEHRADCTRNDPRNHKQEPS